MDSNACLVARCHQRILFSFVALSLRPRQDFSRTPPGECPAQGELPGCVFSIPFWGKSTNILCIQLGYYALISSPLLCIEFWQTISSGAMATFLLWLPVLDVNPCSGAYYPSENPIPSLPSSHFAGLLHSFMAVFLFIVLRIFYDIFDAYDLNIVLIAALWCVLSNDTQHLPTFPVIMI